MANSSIQRGFGLLGVAILASVLSLSALQPAAAETARAFAIGDVTISDPWARQTARAGANSASFMQITNGGDAPDRLVGAAMPGVERVELHTHSMDNGVMRMRRVEAIELPAHETVTMEPGGLHVMFIGLDDRLDKGEALSLTLTFERAGSIEMTVPVLSIGATSANHHDGDGHGHGHGHGNESTQ